MFFFFNFTNFYNWQRRLPYDVRILWNMSLRYLSTHDLPGLLYLNLRWIFQDAPCYKSLIIGGLFLKLIELQADKELCRCKNLKNYFQKI